MHLTIVLDAQLIEGPLFELLGREGLRPKPGAVVLRDDEGWVYIERDPQKPRRLDPRSVQEFRPSEELEYALYRAAVAQVAARGVERERRGYAAEEAPASPSSRRPSSLPLALHRSRA